MKLPDITPRVFYTGGIVCFLIIGLANLTNFFIFFKANNFFGNLATVGSIAFNFLIMGFFWYLLKSQTSSLPPEDPEDLQASLEEFNKNE